MKPMCHRRCFAARRNQELNLLSTKIARVPLDQIMKRAQSSRERFLMRRAQSGTRCFVVKDINGSLRLRHSDHRLLQNPNLGSGSGPGDLVMHGCVVVATLDVGVPN